MLENPAPAAPDSAPPIKRYAPPNQRNRSLGRRKSVEKNQAAASRNNPVAVGDGGSSPMLNEDLLPRPPPPPALIALEGCARSEALRLLSNRWAAVIHRYNDTSIDLSERPVMYSGSSDSAWRNFRLPHQMMSPTNSTGPSSGSQMDFLGELRRAIRSANSDN